MTADSNTPVMDFLSRLLSHGLSHPDAIEEAANFEATLRQATTSMGPAEMKRQMERDRKAAQRAKRVGQTAGQGSAAISSSGINNGESIPEERNSCDSIVPDKPKASKGSRIADDWQPSAEDRTYAITKLNLTLPEFEGCAEDMKLWALANANRAVARKADWSLTFKGWMRRAAPQIVRNRPRGGGGGFNGQAANAGGGKTGFSGIAARIRSNRADDELQPRPAPADLKPFG